MLIRTEIWNRHKGSLKNLLTEGGMSGRMRVLSMIYGLIKRVFPETVLDDSSGYIDFRRKTETNLTIFTITINGDKLSLSYNSGGFMKSNGEKAQYDNDILFTIQEILMRLCFYPVFEFYEEHENIAWKHEIYS